MLKAIIFDMDTGRQEISEVIKSHQIQNDFQHLISVSKAEHAKPAPERFARILHKLRISAGDALVITDSHSGTQAAKSAGLTCIGFPHPYSKQQDLSLADILLESIEGLTSSFLYRVHQRSHGQPVTIASTDRLLIRELATENIPALCSIYQNPDVRQFLTDIDNSIEKETAKLEAYIHQIYPFYEYGLWGVFDKESGTLMGRCGIENQKIAGKEEITLSYLLDRNHWGYGYALESSRAVLDYALEELDMHRIVAVIETHNHRSQQTAANLGMKPERELLYKNRPCILFSLSLQ
ncbi:MAG: GNAT family N-acetyltransferase [Lachnospiraceae bacterium]|nr:GNAT family N-acetyltransferase [Lachnospiraceae bacterium]